MRPGPNSKRPRNARTGFRRGPPHHRSNSIDSNGPDIRIRGSASQIFEKYLGLARDANVSGNRVKAENYLQHADHYYRVHNANDSGNRPSPPSNPREGNDSKPDAGGEENRAGEAQA